MSTGSLRLSVSSTMLAPTLKGVVGLLPPMLVVGARSQSGPRPGPRRRTRAGQPVDAAAGGHPARVPLPNVRAVVDAAEHDAQPFIVMELVRGRSLRDLTRSVAATAPGQRAGVRLIRRGAERTLTVETGRYPT